MRNFVTSCLILALCCGTQRGQAQAAPPAPTQAKPAVPVARPANPARLPRVPAIRWFNDQPRQYVLLEPFKYQPPMGGEPIVVPAGFVTDFASIPGPAQIAFNSPSAHDLPAVVHDFLYWRQSCTRIQADQVFYRALEVFGVNKIERFGIRVGLMVGGGQAFRENAADRRAMLPRIIPGNELEVPVTTWREFRKDLRRRRVALDAPDRKTPAYCRGV